MSIKMILCPENIIHLPKYLSDRAFMKVEDELKKNGIELFDFARKFKPDFYFLEIRFDKCGWDLPPCRLIRECDVFRDRIWQVGAGYLMSLMTEQQVLNLMSFVLDLEQN